MITLLDHYNEELRYLRQGGASFARENPQVAARLGLHADKVTDPFVEQLLEGLAFLTARIHARMDREGAEFARQALARLAPAFCQIVPSITSFSFRPDLTSPDAQRSRCIERGSIVHAQLPGRNRPVQFSTIRPVHLLPLRVAAAECALSTHGLPNTVASNLQSMRAVVRIRFDVEGNSTLADLHRGTAQAPGVSRPPISLTFGGDAPLAYETHRTLLSQAEQVYLLAHDGRLDHVVALGPTALRMPANAGWLNEELGGLQGVQALREYFAQPHAFLSVDLHGTESIQQRCPTARSFELIVGLKGEPQRLLGRLVPSMIHLFATPVVNLYERRLDPLAYDPGVTSHWIPVDRMRPCDHHLYALSTVDAIASSGKKTRLSAVFGGAGCGQMQAGGYFSLVRKGLESAATACDASNWSRDHIVIEMPPSFEREGEHISSVQMIGQVCDCGWDRDAVLTAPLTFDEPVGVSHIDCLWVPSRVRPIPDLARCWEAAAFIGESPLAAAIRIPQAALDSLKRWISLAMDEANPVDQRRTASIAAFKVESSLMPCARSAPIGWIQALRAHIEVNATHHADHGAWLFARVVAQALAECVNVNEGFEIGLLVDGHRVSTHGNLAQTDGSFA